MTILDYKLVDDLTLLTDGQVPRALPLVGTPAVVSLGPIAEYAYVQRQSGSPLPPVDTLFRTPLAMALTTALRSPPQLNSPRLEPLPVELTLLSEGFTTLPGWRAFRQRLGVAARQSGFPDATSKGMIVGFHEMVDNVARHSEALETALIGYRWEPGEFEFVVVDAGVGVLRSLRTHPDYAKLVDHGTALRMALSPGESRFGQMTAHGNGFTTLFRNLASLNGDLRFRSGDHSLEMSGVTPSIVNAKPRQRSHFQGLLISVLCRSQDFS